jgi:hypothetical protein
MLGIIKNKFVLTLILVSTLRSKEILTTYPYSLIINDLIKNKGKEREKIIATKGTSENKGKMSRKI